MIATPLTSDSSAYRYSPTQTPSPLVRCTPTTSTQIRIKEETQYIGKFTTINPPMFPAATFRDSPSIMPSLEAEWKVAIEEKVSYFPLPLLHIYSIYFQVCTATSFEL